MKIAHEAPISILKDVQAVTDYDYALVHLFETHPEYYEFFYNARHVLNRQVLLDNSAFELSAAYGGVKFAEWIEKLSPSYYVIPDKLEDTSATISQYEQFVVDFSKLPGLKIGVVQGKTFSELLECYKFMSDKADYIAISFDMSYYEYIGIGETKLMRQMTGRQRFVKDLISCGVWNWSKPHHLLGIAYSRECRFYNVNNIHNIYSVDTSNPVVAGILGFDYNGEFGLNHKPATKLIEFINDDITPYQWNSISYNIAQFKQGI